MTFPRIRAPGLWVLGSVISPTEMEDFDLHQFEAIDGYGGGAYAPTARLVIGGAGVDFTGGTGAGVLGPLTSTAAPGTDGAGLVAKGDGTGPGASLLGGMTSYGLVCVGGSAALGGALFFAGVGGGFGLSATGVGPGAGVVGAGGASGPGGIFTAGGGGAPGAESTGDTTGPGLFGTGGNEGGTGVVGFGGHDGGHPNAYGAEFFGHGNLPGTKAQGGATGDGLLAIGGVTNGRAIVAQPGPNSAGVVSTGGLGSIQPSFAALGNGAGGGYIAMTAPVGSPGADPQANGIWAESVTKAQGNVFSDGAGGYGVRPGGLNIGSVSRVLIGGSPRLRVAFVRPMATATYAPQVTPIANPTALFYMAVYDMTAAYVDIYIGTIAGAVQDPDIVAINLAIGVDGSM